MVLGDSVNTASRLQSIATPGTVLVDDATRHASEAAIAYEDAGMHQVKGREAPVHAWTALRVVAGAGGARRGAGLEAPFVGRERELQTIIDAGEASAHERRARHVAVLGEAGTGKSRLLWEFFKYLDGIEETALVASGPLPELRRGGGVLGAGGDGAVEGTDPGGGGSRSPRVRSSEPPSNSTSTMSVSAASSSRAWRICCAWRSALTPTASTCSAAGGCSSSGWQRPIP